MRATIPVIAALLFPIIALGNPVVLFEDDFSDPSSPGWQMGPLWEHMSSDSVREYLYQTSGGFETDTLTSPSIFIPSTADSLELIVPMYLYAYCASMSGGSFFTHQKILASSGGSQPQIVWEFYDEEPWATSWECSWADSQLISFPSEVWAPGDSLRLLFVGELSLTGGGYDWIMNLDWRLDSVALLGYGVLSLPSNTWGHLKAAF